jgi:hypothetical protein
MFSNFRDKEAFIIIYDMNSYLEISNLQSRVKKILSDSTNQFSVVLVLGNNTLVDDE